MNILLIHPSAERLQELRQALEYDDNQVYTATSFVRGGQVLKQQKIDFCLLSNLVQDGNVLDFRGDLDKFSQVLSIVLATKPTVKEVVLYLEYGYDEVVSWPIDLMELKARMRSLEKRRGSVEEEEEDLFTIQLGEIEIDLIRRELRFNEQSIFLTTKEFQVLLLLIRESGRILSRREIANELWSGEGSANARTVDVYIRRIRDKLEDFGLHHMIETKWGEGYYCPLSAHPVHRKVKAKAKNDDDSFR